jgi:hypothetical protein
MKRSRLWEERSDAVLSAGVGMNTADNVNRAARHLIAVHGNAAEKVARARAENAAGTERDNVAAIWLQIAAAVSEMQAHTETSATVPEPAHASAHKMGPEIGKRETAAWR